MAIKHKRSSVAGKRPTAADIEDGQLVLNTADALLFMKKANGDVARIGADMATATDIHEGQPNKVLHPDKVWVAHQFVTLAYGPIITMNCAAAINAKVTLTGNAQLTFATPKQGQGGAIEVIQDATGGRILTYGANCDWGGNGPPTLSATPGKTDTIFYFVGSSGVVRLSIWGGS